MTDYTATCHTAGCMNNGTPVLIEGYDPEAFGPINAVCGPCGQPIEDVTEGETSDPGA